MQPGLYVFLEGKCVIPFCLWIPQTQQHTLGHNITQMITEWKGEWMGGLRAIGFFVCLLWLFWCPGHTYSSFSLNNNHPAMLLIISMSSLWNQFRLPWAIFKKLSQRTKSVSGLLLPTHWNQAWVFRALLTNITLGKLNLAQNTGQNGCYHWTHLQASTPFKNNPWQHASGTKECSSLKHRLQLDPGL